MDTRLDLTILPVSPSQVMAQKYVEEIFTAADTRRPGRGRAADRLAFYFPQTTSSLDTAKQMEQWSALYYKTSGPVTSALRVLIEQLNQSLLGRAQQATAGSMPRTEAGVPFTGMVLRHTENSVPILYAAQCGAMHILHVTSQTIRHYYDPQRAGSGLGINRAAAIHFLQFELHAGDFLLLTHRLPSRWDASSLRSVHGQGMDKMHRYLLGSLKSDGDTPPAFIVLYAQPGSGQFQLVSAQVESQAVKMDTSAAAPGKPSAPVPVKTIPTTAPPAQAMPLKPSLAGGEIPEAGRTPLEKIGTMSNLQSREADEDVSSSAAPPPAGKAEGVAPHRPAAEEEDLSKQQSETGFKTSLQTKLDTFRSRIAPLYRRFVPAQPAGQVSSMPSLPAPVMAFIAVAVPVLVVAVTSILYLQRGVTSLNQNYYQKAQSLAVRAISETDDKLRRQILHDSLDYLNQAESYQITNESKSLRNYINSVVDELDGTIRLNFQPVLGGRLPGSVNIQRMILLGDDMYLFNAEGGNVLRARRNEQTFEIDSEFYCGPGAKVGAFVDITLTTWTPASRSPTINGILGMDAQGAVQYCFPKEEVAKIKESEKGTIKTTETLPAPQDFGWSAPVAILYDLGTLYVLDPPNDAIWKYVLDENGEYSRAPTLLFVDKPEIQDTTRMAIYRERLYLLHKDGRVTTCYYDIGYKTPTRCENPSPFTDNRQKGKNSSSRLTHPDGTAILFNQIIISPPPDPSIFLLEAQDLSAYHFSLRLLLQRQFRAQQDLVDARRPASAFVIGNDRTIYMAIGNNIYAAVLP